MKTGTAKSEPHLGTSRRLDPQASPTPSVCWRCPLETFYRRCGAIPWRRFSFRHRADTSHEARRQARDEIEPAPRCADRTLLLADAERLEDFHHARRVRAALRRASCRYFQGRAIRAALSRHL